MEAPVDSVGAGVDSFQPPVLPSWLTNPDPAPIAPSREGKALLFVQFEAAFPRIMEMIASGYTLSKALREHPIELDSGAFLRWINKDHQRKEAYKEAKELRSEAWAGKLIEYAEGENTLEDVNRSKLKVDTLKWLMAADNRRTYGDTKQIELGGSISITAALSAAQQRLGRVVDMEIVDQIDRSDHPRIGSNESEDD